MESEPNATNLFRIEDEGADQRDALDQAGELDSRVLIEQATGILAELGRMGIDEAFAVLRTYARNNNVSLPSAAEAIIGAHTEHIQRPEARIEGTADQEISPLSD